MTDPVRELFLDALGGDRAATPAQLVAACCATLDVDHVAVLLATPSAGLELAAASDPVATRWVDAQVTVGDGPAVEAFAVGGPVLVPDLDDSPPDRWPALAGALDPHRVGAVHSLPLQVGAIRLGVLDLLHDRAHPLAGEALRAALTVADMITTTLLVGSADGADAALAQADTEPWAGTEVGAEIHQATGMVLVQLDVTAAEAYLRLRAHAFGSGRPLLDVARDVVARRLRLEPARLAAARPAADHPAPDHRAPDHPAPRSPAPDGDEPSPTTEPPGAA